MIANRFLNLVAALLFLGLGGVIGVTIHHLWTPEDGAAATALMGPPAAHASDSAVAGPEAHDVAPRPETDVSRVVRQVSDSVVTVGAIKRAVIAQPWFDSFLFAPRWRYQERFQRMPYIGSGFIVANDGLVLTNFHVIEDSEAYFVTLPDGREFPARLVDADQFTDIALLRIEADGEPLPAPLPLADSDSLQLGERVVAIGNPFGPFIADSRPTITVGYISALNRTFAPDRRNRRVYQDMIQTDAAINPGNSGGPLVDMNGHVVGVNTFIVSPSGTSAGIGFAIPTNRVSGFLDEIVRYGRLRPLLLDFAFQTVRLRNGETAVQIVNMEEDGPAERAGLRTGDLLVRADGRDVRNRDDFYLLFASKQVGDMMELAVLRDGRERRLAYEIAEAPRG